VYGDSDDDTDDGDTDDGDTDDGILVTQAP
jgi:hypothetical protein